MTRKWTLTECDTWILLDKWQLCERDLFFYFRFHQHRWWRKPKGRAVEKNKKIRTKLNMRECTTSLYRAVSEWPRTHITRAGIYIAANVGILYSCRILWLRYRKLKNINAGVLRAKHWVSFSALTQKMLSFVSTKKAFPRQQNKIAFLPGGEGGVGEKHKIKTYPKVQHLKMWPRFTTCCFCVLQNDSQELQSIVARCSSSIEQRCVLPSFGFTLTRVGSRTRWSFECYAQK